jgi:hypothetical protein
MKHASDSTFSRLKASPRAIPALAARLALSAALAFSGVAAAEQCQPVNGKIFPLRPCTSDPNDGCFVGSFDGGLTGTVRSQLTSLKQVPGHPDSVIFTATSVITVAGGTITTTDVGIGTSCMGLGGPCPSSNEILTITSGTDAYEKAYGTIFLTGAYRAGGDGRYQGQICTGKPKRNRD